MVVAAAAVAVETGIREMKRIVQVVVAAAAAAGQ
jgi:hypothetical protein